MAFPSPTRSSPTLDRYLRHESGSKSSHSPSIYARVPTKPKKFQSAHYDETTGTWRCKHCGYTYPNPEPHHHQRRAHKKICQGTIGKVHRWLSLSTGQEAEDAQDSSNVVYKPTTPESSDSAATLGALGQQDKNAGLEDPRLSDRKFKFHETRSSNELPRKSEIQELGDPKGILSDQHGLLAAGENEARRKGELDFEPRTVDLDRLLTLNSDVSLPRGPSLHTSDPVDFSGVPSSDYVPLVDVSAGGNQEGRDIDKEEPLSLSSRDEAHSLKLGEDVLTADDGLETRTEVAQGVLPTPSSSDGNRLKDSAPEDLAEGFHQREPSLNARDGDRQGKRAEVLQQGEESQVITTEDRNAEESRVTMGEGFGETEALVPAAAEDGALREKEEEMGSEQSVVNMGGDGTEYKSGDEHESSQLVRGAGDEEASQHARAMDQSSGVVHASEEVDVHAETAEVDAKSFEPRSDDSEGVTETPPNTSKPGPSVKLSSAERNWDDWEHVVSGDDTSGQEKLPSLPQEIDDEGPPVSEDGLTSSQSDNLEDVTADMDPPMLESPETAVLTADQAGDHEIGFQPAGLDWTLAFPDTVNVDVDKQKPVGSLESSTSVGILSSPDEDGQELIPGLGEEANQPKKVVLRLSAAEANWDDWEDVIKRGPMLMEGMTLRKDQDSESSGEYQTPRVDSLGVVSGLEQGKAGTISEFESFVEGGAADMIEAGRMLMEGITLRKGQDTEYSGEDQTPRVDSLGDVSGLGQGKTGIVSEFESFVEGGVTDLIEAGQKLMEGISLRKAQDPESSREYGTPQVDFLGDVSGLGQGNTGTVSEFESFVESGVTDVIKSGEMLMEGISLRKAQDPESSGEYQSPRANSLGDDTGLGQGKTSTVSEVKSFVEGGVADVIKRGLKLLEGITLRKAQDPKSSGEHQTPRVDSHGDVSELGQGKTGTSLESESFVEGGGIDTAAAAGLPVHIPDNESSDWLIDFSEPSVDENNPGTANEEAKAAISASNPKLEVPRTKFLDLLDLNEDSGHEGASLLDGIPVTPQSETGQSSKEVLSKLSSALRNWEDWDDVVRESERLSRSERSRPVLESDLGDGEHENGLESPNRSDSNTLDSGSSKQAGSVEPLKTPPVASNSDTAINSELEIDGLSHGKQPDAMVTSVPEEGDPLLRFPKAKLEPNVSSNSLPPNLNGLDSGLDTREGRKELGDNEDISRYESVQAGVDNLWEDDWEVVQKNEYPPAGSRHSSPSFEDAHDGELSSEHEFSTGLPTAVNLPLGKRRWADWEDLTKSEYMVLDGPDGESLVFKRTADARDKVSAKVLGGRRETPTSFEEPDEGDGGSPSLRRRRRQAPPFDDDRSPSFRALKGASPRGVVKSDYTAGSNSFQGFETTPRSLPASSPRKSESGDLAPLVTRRPLIYRGSRRDYASEVEDQDVTSEPPLGHHLHHHNLHEHEDALKYDVEKVLRGQTTYELICPICGALITRKIIIRKKKRTFVSEGDSRWRRETSEITPVEDDVNRSPRSDMSSEIEDLSGAWKQGIRPCFGYFFGS